MTKQREIYDITIVGAGPVGLFAGFYAGLRQAKTKIIDSLSDVGGQLSLLYPEKHIYDVPGFPKIKAQSLIDLLKEQINPFDYQLCLNEEVFALEQEADGIIRITTNQQEHYSRAVILATGKGSFQPRRLKVAGSDLCEHKSLHYFINQPEIFQNKSVVVCGGGDSAVDWALMLAPIAKQVTLVHRRDEFRAHEYSLSLLKQSNVMIKTPYVIEQIDHQQGHIQHLVLHQVKTQEKERLLTDQLIVSYGFAASNHYIKNWPIHSKRNQVVVHSDMSTSLNGVYAIGDINHYDGKVALIATGFGEAPIAVNNALHYLNPKQRAQPTHSTSLFSS